MTALILRADAIEAVRKHFKKYFPYALEYGEMLCETLSAIPSAEAEQGEWIEHKGEWIDCDFYPTKYECSQCHYCVDEGYDSIFCPNCGAKMESKKEYLDKTFPEHDGGEWFDITDIMTREIE